MGRRIIGHVIAAVLLTGVVACGDDDASTSGASAAGNGVASTAASAPTTIPTATSNATPTVPATAVPAPPTSPAPPPTTVVAPLPPVPRVLLVGDSTLLSVGEFGALVALRGMDPVYQAASCRALGQPSCGKHPPINSVNVIDGTEGNIDVVIIMAGYDEWFTTFAESFDQVIASARAKGAKRIVWLTYPEGVDYVLPDDRKASESLINMNRIMFERVASGGYPDVLIADWFRYAAATQGWFEGDDIHLTRTGAFGVADYISRKVAFAAGQPCPVPREVNGAVESPCPDPDVSGPVPDVVSLYAA